jgi:hypothetical protein
VEGTVLSKEEYCRFGGIPAGRVKIQIAETNAVVIALVNRSVLERLGQQVRFHYTGDPVEEVFLEGEEDPVWAFGVAMFFLVCPTVLLVLYCRLKGKPGFEHLLS